MSATIIRGRVAAALLMGGLAALAVAAPSSVQAASNMAGSAAAHVVTPATHMRAGVMPLFTGPHALRHQSPQVSGAHLTYYGGHVISNVQVVQVLWGSGSYTPEVQNTAAPSIASFYGGVTNSSYYDWLNEYNTTITAANGQPGTNQTIGRGSFAQQVQITPAAGNDGATIDDTNIQAELKAQIAAGHVPAPTANTYYALYFPANKTITQGGSSSGVQFCAYHGTTASPEVYYGVLPDFTTGGMAVGCGNGTTFQNETSVSSHELVEATTDAEVGLATTNAPPLAWYDNTNGEIGDICNGQQQAITGGDGRTYTVQQQWSNVQGACVVHGTAPANDFSLVLSPTSLTVAPGGHGTSHAQTAVTSGSPGTISLTSSGAPSGISVSFSPTSVTAGASSTITVAATTAVAAGNYAITVTGTSTSSSHAAALSVTIGRALTNGGFETGTLAGWKPLGSTSVVNAGAQSGTYAAQVGSTGPSGDSSIAQTFNAPVGANGIQLYYDVFCPDTIAHDWATASLKDNTAGTTAVKLLKKCVNPSSGWTAVSAPVTAGHSYTLKLANHDDNIAGNATHTLYDSVSFTSPSVTNGGFETGTLAGWTPGGASTGISTTAHSGSYSAMTGSTAATNGDSTLSQAFTAPTGTSTLSLFYANTCPDTVTYDWATVTITDNTAGGTSATVVPHTCAATSAWTQATTAVIAGHNYTLFLTSHDDNYATDPTYTLYDDITLS